MPGDSYPAPWWQRWRLWVIIHWLVVTGTMENYIWLSIQLGMIIPTDFHSIIFQRVFVNHHPAIARGDCKLGATHAHIVEVTCLFSRKAFPWFTPKTRGEAGSLGTLKGTSVRGRGQSEKQKRVWECFIHPCLVVDSLNKDTNWGNQLLYNLG